MLQYDSGQNVQQTDPTNNYNNNTTINSQLINWFIIPLSQLTQKEKIIGMLWCRVKTILNQIIMCFHPSVHHPSPMSPLSVSSLSPLSVSPLPSLCLPSLCLPSLSVSCLFLLCLSPLSPIRLPYLLCLPSALPLCLCLFLYFVFKIKVK